MKVGHVMTEQAEAEETGWVRIVYVAGPGHVANTYRQWKLGQVDATQVSQTY